MNFYYVEVRHAEAVESKYLHVVTHLSKKQMYKITQSFVCDKYRIVIKSCDYKETCKYLGYDPFTGLDKFLEKCENVKLYKKVTTCKAVPLVEFKSYDFSKWYDIVKIESATCKYDRCFVNFQSKNSLMQIKQTALLAWLHANTGTPWEISCMGHYYAMNICTPVVDAKIIDSSKELMLTIQYTDFEEITEFQII